MSPTTPAPPPPTVEIGWCDTRDVHDGRYDHRRVAACVGFVSDAEHTARLLAQTSEHDARSGHAGQTEASYVAQHRPY